MDPLKLAAEHLLLLRRRNAARSWLQTKGLKFNQPPQAWADGHGGVLFMGWGSGLQTTTTWSLKNIRGQLAFHMAAAKAKTWKLLESEADESTKHSPVKADTLGNDNLENNKLCVLVPIHKPTDRFSINPWCSQRWFKTPDSFLFTSRRVFCHYSSVWAFHYWSTSTSYVASYKEIEIFTFWSSRKVWRFKKGETVNKFNSEVQGSPRNANMIDYGQKYSLERIIMFNNEATYSC